VRKDTPRPSYECQIVGERGVDRALSVARARNRSRQRAGRLTQPTGSWPRSWAMNTPVRNVPLAYMITFRTYGTWLHGDARGSVDRHRNDYATPTIRPNSQWNAYNRSLLTHPPVHLDARRRRCIDESIRATCAFRGWAIHALNVRTNHVHTVVSAPCIPESILRDLKAYATRSLRETGCWAGEHCPWGDGGSTRYLWTENALACAITYVVEWQGPALD
jgi:REP element-mobilizing transposase RayT